MNDKLFKIFCAAALGFSLDCAAASNMHNKEEEMALMCGRGEPLDKAQCIPCFNAPASIALHHPGSWMSDMFIDTSFIYWHAEEEGLEIASSAAINNAGAINNVADIVTQFQDFDYTPGFKFGVGMRHEDLLLHFEYTWLRDTTETHSSAPAANPSSLGTGVWVLAPWFFQTSAANHALTATEIASKWRLHMDLLDGDVSRPFYQGRYLTVAPFAGLRTAWIRQVLTVKGFEATQNFTTLASQPIFSHNRSYSWGIGPRIGLGSYALLPMGFRLQGDCSASLLFTQYTTISHQEDAGASGGNSLKAHYSYYNTLRPNMEIGLGFGWGQYIFNQKFHVDFSAQYDFMIFWSQNMMRTMLDQVWNKIPALYDLHLHGLTLSGRFDF